MDMAFARVSCEEEWDEHDLDWDKTGVTMNCSLRKGGLCVGLEELIIDRPIDSRAFSSQVLTGKEEPSSRPRHEHGRSGASCLVKDESGKLEENQNPQRLRHDPLRTRRSRKTRIQLQKRQVV